MIVVWGFFFIFIFLREGRGKIFQMTLEVKLVVRVRPLN